MRNRLRSPESWMFASCLSGVLGLIVLAIAVIRHNATLKTIALWLMAPMALCVAILLLVLLPLLLYFNWRNKKKRGR